MYSLSRRGGETPNKCTNVLFPSYPRSTRPWSCLKRVARPSRSGSSSTTCATGSWCGALPISVPGKWPTSTQTCWARRAAGQRWQSWHGGLERKAEKTSNSSLFWLSFSGHVRLHESCVPQHAARRWGQAVWRGRGGALQVSTLW